MISSSARTGIRIRAMPRSAASAAPASFRRLIPGFRYGLPRWSFLLSGLPGLLLLVVSVLFIFGLINTLLSNQQLLFQAMLAGLMLAFLWYLYMHLPASCADSFPDCFIDPTRTTNMAIKHPNTQTKSDGFRTEGPGRHHAQTRAFTRLFAPFPSPMRAGALAGATSAEFRANMGRFRGRPAAPRQRCTPNSAPRFPSIRWPGSSAVRRGP